MKLITTYFSGEQYKCPNSNKSDVFKTKFNRREDNCTHDIFANSNFNTTGEKILDAILRTSFGNDVIGQSPVRVASKVLSSAGSGLFGGGSPRPSNAGSHPNSPVKSDLGSDLGSSPEREGDKLLEDAGKSQNGEEQEEEPSGISPLRLFRRRGTNSSSSSKGGANDSRKTTTTGEDDGNKATSLSTKAGGLEPSSSSAGAAEIKAEDKKAAEEEGFEVVS